MKRKTAAFHTAALHRIISQSALVRSSALPIFDCFFSLDIFILKNAFTQFVFQNHITYVYHCIYCETDFGILYNLLYVSKYEDEWEYEFEDLKNGVPTAYVINETVPYYSESGSIGVKPLFGALIRTY